MFLVVSGNFTFGKKKKKKKSSHLFLSGLKLKSFTTVAAVTVTATGCFYFLGVDEQAGVTSK